MRSAVLPLIAALVVASSAVFASPAGAVPTQFGDTGLLSQPSADTLDAGNISFGLWFNHSDNEESSASIVPASLTLGLGSFLEVYGSYPNLLFNDDDLASGRGDIRLGFKARILGKRSSAFKLALDLQGGRSVSDDPDFDGINSYQGRVIASLKPERFGMHVNAGYRSNDDPSDIDFDDQFVAGVGIEFFPETRLRMIAEMDFASQKVSGAGEEGEATIGVQYFVSPHLTVNFGLGFGVFDASPDWRALAGFSTSQGVGTYFKSVPRIIQPADETTGQEAEEKEKTAKIQPLSPILAGQVKPRRLGPVAQLEVPVEVSRQEIVLTPGEVLPLPATTSVKTHPFSPVAPMSAGPPVAAGSAVSAPGATSQSLRPAAEKPITTFVYRKFRLPEFTFGFDQWSLSEEGKKALSEIIADLRQEGRWFLLRIDGHTDSIGSESYNTKLSLKRAISMGSYLAVNEGLNPDRIFVKGFGENQPVAPNDSAEGRSANRRAEILVLVPREN